MMIMVKKTDTYEKAKAFLKEHKIKFTEMIDKDEQWFHLPHYANSSFIVSKRHPSKYGKQNTRTSIIHFIHDIESRGGKTIDKSEKYSFENFKKEVLG